MNSRKITVNGRPEIEADGRKIDACAYVTYFTENNDYSAFAKAGYSLFSVCTYFTELPINEGSGFSPARKGIFDRKDAPDYSEFDADMHQLLRACPDAMVFPRIYVSMPLWWVQENPTEIMHAECTPEGREMLFSERFRADGSQLLRAFIRHVRASDYANSIIGYQISGGATQEWFHFDRKGSICENAYPYFAEYAAAHGIKTEKADFLTDGKLNEKYADAYMSFANESVADTVALFARVAKEETDFSQIVGAFYGYCLEVHDPLAGTHAFAKLLDCPDIDFFSSPFSYVGLRSLGEDWVAMLPEDSVALHGKLLVTEADVRTHLSKYPDQCRADIRLKNLYRGPIWLGGPTESWPCSRSARHSQSF